MKRYILLIISLLIFQKSNGQPLSGKVVSFVLNSKALQNTGGEDPNRKVSLLRNAILSFITCMDLWGRIIFFHKCKRS